MNIGQKIKRLRLQKNLTLSELASRCELTKGFLSQIENDISSPSISTLNDILEALGTNLAEFFSEDNSVKTVFHKEDFFEDERENYTISWIVPNSQRNDMEPIMISIPPMSETFEMAPHTGEEFGMVLEGKIILEIAGNRQTVKKGETFYLTGKDFHKLINNSKTNAKVLWVSTPPLF